MLRPPGKLYVGLTEVPLIAGVQKPLFMMNVGVALIAMLGLRTFIWLPVAFIIHFVLKNMTKNDPFLRDLYLVFQRQADRYEPFPESRPKRRLRPLECGRGVVG